jgi:hypothetical protein
MQVMFAAIVATMVMTTAAVAACPLGTRYQCQQGFNGKVICGCR